MNLEEQLSAVLNDPEAMSKISSIISALGSGEGAPAAAETQQAQPQQVKPQQNHSQQSAQPVGGFNIPDISGDNRTKLLMALKPFLSEKRAPYVDGAVAILKMMQLGKLGRDIKLF